MQHERCVLSLLRRHYSRYTPEMVERVCGTPRDNFLQIAETLAQNSGRERTTAFAYALGWTQHSDGVQFIRTAAVLQMLLGNIGRPGGGIMALRGHADIQGATDIATLYDLLPGYLADALGEPQRTNARGLLEDQHQADRLVGEHAEVRDLAAQSILRQGSDQRKRLLLRVSCRSLSAIIRSSRRPSR